MPEIVLEGITDPDTVRDWLYEHMRGAKGIASPLPGIGTASLVPPKLNEHSDDVTELLRGIRDNLASMVEKSTRSSGSAS